MQLVWHGNLNVFSSQFQFDYDIFIFDQKDYILLNDNNLLIFNILLIISFLIYDNNFLRAFFQLEFSII